MKSAKIFVGGGGVLWTPVVAGTHGRIKTPDLMRKYSVKPEERCGWLASRQPPLSEEKRGSVHNPLLLDLTDRLRSCKGKKNLEILYDCRFLLRFHMDKMPDDIVKSVTGPGRDDKILVQPQSRWYRPKVVWQRPGKEDEVLGIVADDDGHQDEYWSLRSVKETPQTWIDIEWIRSLDAM